MGKTAQCGWFSVKAEQVPVAYNARSLSLENILSADEHVLCAAYWSGGVRSLVQAQHYAQQCARCSQHRRCSDRLPRHAGSRGRGDGQKVQTRDKDRQHQPKFHL